MTTIRRGPGRTDPTTGMIEIPGGTFMMGSDAFYPEEQPRRRVKVDRFWIDPTPVTNRQFSDFVAATGHVTFAGIAPEMADYPGMDPALAQPGSLVFRKTDRPVPLHDFSQWWEFSLGADWRHPCGPDSSLEGLEDHPVVHVAYADALAYARWAGKSLPTEAEFEFTARGRHDGREYAWGTELMPDGRLLANFWQGRFPHENTLADGWERTSPVQYYPPNDYGVYDMIGNVWEWTCDWYAMPQPIAKKRPSACCTIPNPRGGRKAESFDANTPQVKIGRRVIKGGSHLCAESYCQRYRPAARHPESVDTSTSHIGFRCVVRG